MGGIAAGKADYIGAVYYYKGLIDSCTDGFEAGNIKMQTFTLTAGKCGDDATGLIP